MYANRIDLHMHSLYSDDGEFTPRELVKKCSEQGVTVMAIADHNSIKANYEAKQAAKEANIKYIPAIEIDCTFQSNNYHVLGYAIDYENTDFLDIENNINRQNRNASLQMLRAIQNMGFRITESDMIKASEKSYREDTWTGEMFAEVLLEKQEYIDHPLLLPYHPNGSRGDNPYVNFYWDYFSQGKPCYVRMDYPELEHVVEIIHRNGGYAVLAHPGVYKDENSIIDNINKTCLDGIEAFSSYHTPAQALNYYNITRQNKLFTSCGSDYHGKTKPSVYLGRHGCSLSEEEMLHELQMILSKV